MSEACGTCGQKNIQDLWVTEDGTYGFYRIALVDTSGWTDEDMQELEDCSDEERMEVATNLATIRGGGYKYA